MKCDHFRKDLHAYLDGLLSEGPKAELEGHLAVCRDCREALEELRQSLQILGDLGEVEPPEWLTRKVMAAIRAKQPERHGFLSRLRPGFRFGIPAAAAATLAIAVTALLVMKEMEPKVRETVGPQVLEQRPLPALKGPAGPASPHPQEEPAAMATGKATETGRQMEPLQKTPPDSAEQARAEKKKAAPAQAETDRDGKGVDTSADRPDELQPGPAPARQEPVRENRSPAPKKESPETPALSRGPAARGMPSALKPAAAPSKPGPPEDRDGLKDIARPERGLQMSEVGEELAAGAPARPYERVITDRHPNGAPRLIVTYLPGGGQRKLMEERFDEEGRRHGLHTAHDDAGRLIAEVEYRHGEIREVKEFNPDGSLKSGPPGRNWPWLKPATGRP